MIKKLGKIAGVFGGLGLGAALSSGCTVNVGEYAGQTIETTIDVTVTRVLGLFNQEVSQDITVQKDQQVQQQQQQTQSTQRQTTQQTQQRQATQQTTQQGQTTTQQSEQSQTTTTTQQTQTQQAQVTEVVKDPAPVDGGFAGRTLVDGVGVKDGVQVTPSQDVVVDEIVMEQPIVEQQVMEQPDHTTVWEQPDETTVWEQPDSNIIMEQPDETTVWEQPDNNIIMEQPDETNVIIMEQGSDGNIIMEGAWAGTNTYAETHAYVAEPPPMETVFDDNIEYGY